MNDENKTAQEFKISIDLNDVYSYRSFLFNFPLINSLSIRLNKNIKKTYIKFHFLSLEDYLDIEDIFIEDFFNKLELTFNSFKININKDKLSQLKIIKKGILFVEVIEDNKILTYLKASISLYPNFYFDLDHYSLKVLSSFINPNDSIVTYDLDKIKSDYYLKHSKEISLGYGIYLDSLNDILEEVYLYFLKKNLFYLHLDSSYLNKGIYIKSYSDINNQKKATLVDLSLYFSAILSRLNLNTILIFIKNNIYLGVWTYSEHFNYSENDDNSLLNSFLSIERVIPINILSIFNKLNFKDNIKESKNELIKYDKEILYLDVVSSFKEGFIPLIEENIENLETNELYDFNNISSLDILKKKDKFKYYLNRLMDFSKSNKLMNFSLGSFSLELILNPSSLSYLYLNKENIKLESNLDLSFLSRKKPLDYKKNSNLLSNVKEIIDNKVEVFGDKREYSTILSSLYKKSNFELNESGTNTLYLSFGLISYNENKRTYYAPLFLFPISLNKVNKDYYLSFLDIEPSLNLTIITYLKDNFFIDLVYLKEEIKKIESNEFNFDNVILDLKDKLKDKKDFKVYPNIFISRFFFKKLIIYNDLILNKEKIFSHNIAKSFIDSINYLKEDKAPFLSYEEIDKHLSYKDLAIPLSYDSSQIEAIINASNKKSFVLIGPPGTGKSQTIANIIFNALYNDKKVLFCSEKKCALDIVYDRLKEVKLDNFILELHSNKASKSEILSSLEKSASFGEILNHSGFKFLSENLDIEKKFLEKKFSLIHKKSLNDLSLYEAINLDSNENNSVRVYLDNEFTQNVSKRKIEEVNSILLEAKEHSLKLDENYKNYFKVYKNTNYSIEIRNNLKKELDDLTLKLKEYLELESKIKEDSSINLDIDENILEIFSINEDFKLYINLLKSNNPINKIDLVIKKIVFLKNYDLKKEKLCLYFNENILDFDKKKIELLNKNLNSKKSTKVKTTKFKIKLLFNKYLRKKIKLDEKTLLDEFNLLAHLVSLKEEYEFIKKEIKITLNISENIDYSLLLESLEHNKKVVFILKSVENKNEPYLALVDKIYSLFNSSLSLKTFAKYFELNKEIKNGLNILKEHYSFDFSLISSKSYYLEVFKTLDYINTNINNLYDYSYILLSLNKLKALKLNSLVNLYCDENYNFESILKIFNDNIYKDIIEFLSLKLELNTKYSKDYNLVKEVYKKDFKKYQNLVVVETISKLSKKLPSLDFSLSSEYSILKKYIKSLGKGMSLRSFLNLIPSLIFRLKPCFLVSPISVAKYLNSDKYHFDIVIFDEASQIPTYEAISSIIRGDSLVIAGDDKQLPPTSFFERLNKDNNDDSLYIGELDSILDDALTLSFLTKRLNYHYRSKDESLIYFSNSHFYNNELITFPSKEINKKNIILKYIPNGIYDIGRSNTNKNEATVLIEDLINEIKNNKNKTFGVITFSIHQMELIDNLLEERIEKDKELNEIINSLKEEVFVKNLENVQGDERDYIFISLGYGKNKNAKLTLNFGPLNNLGGERRLNVALTRSKEKLFFYSSIKDNEINLNKTNSLGIRYLKEFLTYSKNYIDNRLALPLNQKDELTISLINFLEENGYKTNVNIGKSKFKVDIGIINPLNENEYILGLIIDKDNFVKDSSINDKVLVQNDVLVSLGWNLYFIFSYDFYKNKEKILKEILVYLENLVDEYKIDYKIAGEINSQKEEITFEKKKIEDFSHFKKYAKISLKNYYKEENLIDLRNKETIYKLIKNIIEIESPISESFLIKRIYELFSIKRKNKEVTSVINFYLTRLNNYKNISYYPDNYFYFKDNVKYNDDTIKYTSYYRNRSLREMEEISKEELRVIFLEIIKKNISIEIKELKKIVLLKLGFKSKTKKIDDILNYEINYLEKELKEVEIKDNNIYLI